MSTSKEFKDYILENLTLLDSITYKPMMGEYLLYYKNQLFGGLYDDRFLIKKTVGNQKYHLKEEIPYENAKTMYFVEEVENRTLLKEIILTTVEDLFGKK